MPARVSVCVCTRILRSGTPREQRVSGTESDGQGRKWQVIETVTSENQVFFFALLSELCVFHQLRRIEGGKTTGGGRNATRDDGRNVKIVRCRLRETPPEHVPAPDPDRPVQKTVATKSSASILVQRRQQQQQQQGCGARLILALSQQVRYFSNLPISNIQ